MRAVRRTKRGIEVVDAPAPRGDGLRVRIRSAGICQTDVNLCRLGPLPQILGHELAGELADGTPVAIEPLVPCGHCRLCERGDYHLCPLGPAMIFGIGFDGGMAEELVVPPRCVVPLPTGLDASSACLVEPLAVNLHGLGLAALRGGQRVAVCGVGIAGFGLLAAAAARWRGGRVELEAEREHQAAAADALGIRTRVEGDCDLVIEAEGSERSIARAAELCAPGGTLLLVAGYYSDKLFPVLPCALKELHLIWGTFYGHSATGRDADAAAALLAQQPEIARAVISHRFPLEAAAEAFALAETGERSRKVVLEP